jgi:hypothetical protein
MNSKVNASITKCSDLGQPQSYQSIKTDSKIYE